MKAVFISLYQAFYDEVMEILDKNEIRGFTFWNEVQGRGSDNGERATGYPRLRAKRRGNYGQRPVEAFHETSLRGCPMFQ